MAEKTRDAPYIRKFDTRGDIEIWLVDGNYIRGHLDEEFTDFGQHYRYSFIPEKEFWLDVGVGHKERKFFIDHLLVEYRLMKKGVRYNKAVKKADRAEQKERGRSGDGGRATHHGRRSRDGQSVHRRLWKELGHGVCVWIVNGRRVRSVFDTDFTEGGHDQVYKFVPEGEIWIDDAVVEQERGFVLLHELHERNLMAQGMSYDKAHAQSSRLEVRCRHHPDKLDDALAAEEQALREIPQRGRGAGIVKRTYRTIRRLVRA